MDPAGLPQLQELFQRIIGLVVPLAFVVLLIMLLYAGFKFLTSGGEPKALQSAGGTVTWAILGIVFLVLAWLVLRLIEAFTGITITNFCFGFKPYCV